MTPRLTTEMLVGALLRRTDAAGGSLMVLHKGDPIAGTLLLQLMERGAFIGLFERMTSLDGTVSLVRCGPAESSQQSEIVEYISRRRRSDPDFWLVELDIANGERFAAETIASA